VDGFVFLLKFVAIGFRGQKEKLMTKVVRRGWKARAVSLAVVIAMVTVMLPVGALTAFAAVNGNNTYYVGGTTQTVVRGVGSSQSQLVSDITIKEDSANKDAFPAVDQTINLTTPNNVTFAGKPSVKVNGTAVTVTTNSSSDISFDVGGTDNRDEISITNIKLYVGSASGTTLQLMCEDPADEADASADMNIDVANIRDGLIVSAIDPETEVEIGENNQMVSPIALTESATNTLETDDTFSITCPDGVTFYEPPEIVESVTGFSLDIPTASLSSDQKTATWTINEASNNQLAQMMIYATINVASTVATRTDIKFTFATSNSEYAIAPSPSKVAEAVSMNDLTVTADSTPAISKTAAQAASDITIKEAVDGLLSEDTFTVTIETPGCFFATSPLATPAGGLTLENSDGDAVTTSVAGALSKTSGAAHFNTSTWTITDQSTNPSGGTISIKGLVVNVDPSAQTGPLVVRVAGCGMFNTVTVANIIATPLANVAATSAPTIKINVSNQDAGEITITETGAGALAATNDGIVLKIFGVTTDDEIKFSEKPTVSVVSGDIDMSTTGTLTNLNGGSTGAGTDARYAIPIYDESGKASTIKISGIKYDVNSKAIEGSVQVVVMNGATRIATVSNAVVERENIDIPANITAQTDIQPNSKGWFKTAPKITLTADNQNASIFYKWDGSSWGTYTQPLTAPEGIHTLYYSPDPNNAAEVKSLETKVDTGFPSYSHNEYPWPSGTVSGEINVSLNASDLNSGVETTYLLIDGEIVDEDSETPYLYNLDTRYFKNGTHTIKMEIYDVAGNVSSNSSTVVFSNGPAPETTVWTDIGPNGYGWLSEKPHIWFETDVDGATTYYAWDYMTEWQEYTEQLLANNGISYLYVYSDKPGCTVEDIYEYEFKVDDIEPVINSTSFPQQNSNLSGNVEVSVDATDSISGIYGVYLLVDGEYAAEDLESPYSITFNTKNYSNGRHTIGLEIYDFAGNYVDRSSEVVFSNSNSGNSSNSGGGGGGAPTTTNLKAPQDLKATAGNNAINLTWSESKDKDVSEYRVYRVDGTGGEDKPSGLKPLATVKSAKYDDTSVKPGTYTYYVTVADAKGNESKAARVVAAYPVVKGEKVFSDVPSTAWYKDFVSALASNGITGGYPDGTFKPDGQVTRAEFAKMICTAMGWTLEDPTNPSFSDVSKSHWAFKYIETIKKHGVTSGYPDGTFGPDKKITRAEIASMIAKALNLPADSSSKISDIQSSWAKGHIGACIKAGIVSGYPDLTFKPGSNASRAEAAKMIMGLLNNKK
jgi:hypothetical protein